VLSIAEATSHPAPLAGGFCFGEGPRWFEGLLWFSDMLGEAIHTVNLRGSMTTVPLPGHTPSGLGFRPDGSLLIASASDRQVLCYDGDTVTTLVDLSELVPADLGDMVVDAAGRAYIGSQAYSGGVLVRIACCGQVGGEVTQRRSRSTEFLGYPQGGNTDGGQAVPHLGIPAQWLGLTDGFGVGGLLQKAGDGVAQGFLFLGEAQVHGPMLERVLVGSAVRSPLVGPRVSQPRVPAARRAAMRSSS